MVEAVEADRLRLCVRSDINQYKAIDDYCMVDGRLQNFKMCQVYVRHGSCSVFVGALLHDLGRSPMPIFIHLHAEFTSLFIPNLTT